MAAPVLTLIITVFNHERFLAEAIESVLHQRIEGLELIVVDDGSTDDSAAVAARFDEVTLIRQRNSGQGSAVNTALTHANGELITFLDADDLLEPDTLQPRIAAFDRDSALQMTHGMLVEFVSPELTDEGVDVARVDGRPFPTRVAGTTMLRRQSFDLVGPMNTDLRVGVWMDWLLRAQHAGIVGRSVGEVFLRRRVHEGNMGKASTDPRRDFTTLLKLALDRRRGSPGE